MLLQFANDFQHKSEVDLRGLVRSTLNRYLQLSVEARKLLEKPLSIFLPSEDNKYVNIDVSLILI